MRTVLAFAAFLSLFVHAAFAEERSDASAIGNRVRTTQIIIADVRTKLRPTLSNQEQTILDWIEFSVDPTISFAGNAMNQGGRRAITVSAGVAFLMNVLGQSIAVGTRGNVPCMQTHLMRSIRDAIE